MARYISTFSVVDFEDFPQIEMNEIIKAKFLSEHGVVVDETNLAVDENGFTLNEIGPTSIKIVVEV